MKKILFTCSLLLASLASADTAFQTVNPVRVWANSEAVSAPPDTNENTLRSFTLPGGILGPNGWLECSTGWATTNGADDKILRVKLASTNYMAATVTTVATIFNLTMIANRNSQSAQTIFWPSNNVFAYGSGTVAATTGTVDTSSDQTVSFTCQKETGTDTCTLNGYVCKAFYAP